MSKFGTEVEWTSNDCVETVESLRMDQPAPYLRIHLAIFWN
jgi:hypothetical protein